MLDDMRSSLKDDAAVSSNGALIPGPSLTPDVDWCDMPDVTLQKTPTRVAPLKPKRILSDMGMYLLVAMIFLMVGLALAAADEKSTTPHLASLSALLMLGTVLSSLMAIYKARKSNEGVNRPVLPSMVDSVTSLPNEEYFRLRLRDEFRRMQRYGSSLSLAVFDVNNLASVNEAYSETTGDAVLKHIAGIIDVARRASDVAARLNDDEFGLILLECGEEDAVRFLGRLERYVGRKPATVSVESQSITLWVGICSGVASAQRGDTNPLELLNQARHSLAAAKEDRDRRRKRWTHTA